MSPDVIERRLSSLPWTLTSRATSETASRLASFLDKCWSQDRLLGHRWRPRTPQSASKRRSYLARSRNPKGRALRRLRTFRKGRAFNVLQQRPRNPRPAIEPGRDIAPLAGQRSLRAPKHARPSGLLVEPLSLGGILDRTFQICRGYFWKLFAVAGRLRSSWSCFWNRDDCGDFSCGHTCTGIREDTCLGIAACGPHAAVSHRDAALSVVLFLTHGACVHAVSCIYLGRDFQVRGAFSFAWSRLRKLYFGMSSVIFILFGLLFGVSS